MPCRLDLTDPVHQWLLVVSLGISASIFLFILWLRYQDHKRPKDQQRPKQDGPHKRRKRRR